MLQRLRVARQSMLFGLRGRVKKPAESASKNVRRSSGKFAGRRAGIHAPEALRHRLTAAVRHVIGAAALALVAMTPAVQAQQNAPLVFAAASLQTALDNIVAAQQAQGGGGAVVSYAATSALARQVEQGAPADLFMSADLEWMDYLEERNLIQADTRTNLLGNRIVLVTAASNPVDVELAPDLDLAGLLGPNGRLAMADTEAVPAGRYGRAALETLGLWGSVSSRLAEAENVRAALALVSRGEAPFGIVYATDAAADPSVRVVALFPEETHPPIIYPVALIADRNNPAAAALLESLRSPTAQCLFEEQGFSVFAADGELAEPVSCAAAPAP